MKRIELGGRGGDRRWTLRRRTLWFAALAGAAATASLVLGTPATAAKLGSFRGTVVVEEAEPGGSSAVYLVTKGGKLLVAGPKTAALKKHAGKTVSVKGTVSKGGKGGAGDGKVLQVTRFKLVPAGAPAGQRKAAPAEATDPPEPDPAD